MPSRLLLNGCRELTVTQCLLKGCVIASNSWPNANGIGVCRVYYAISGDIHEMVCYLARVGALVALRNITKPDSFPQ